MDKSKIHHDSLDEKTNLPCSEIIFAHPIPGIWLQSAQKRLKEAEWDAESQDQVGTDAGQTYP